MGWEVLQPNSIEELHKNLTLLFENKGHVKSIKVEQAARVIRVDLDFAANIAGHKDFEIPIRASMVVEAKEIVAIMLGETERGVPPGRAAAEKLWACIEPGRR